MARQLPLAAQLIADLFVAIEQDDPLATIEATQALADRIGAQAATALASALLADNRRPHGPLPLAPAGDPLIPLVHCA